MKSVVSTALHSIYLVFSCKDFRSGKSPSDWLSDCAIWDDELRRGITILIAVFGHCVEGEEISKEGNVL